MCTAVSFDASLDCERTFFKDLFPKIVKKRGFLNLCRPSKDFLSSYAHNRDELGVVTPTGLPGEADESIVGVDSWSSQGTL